MCRSSREKTPGRWREFNNQVDACGKGLSTPSAFCITTGANLTGRSRFKLDLHVSSACKSALECRCFLSYFLVFFGEYIAEFSVRANALGTTWGVVSDLQGRTSPLGTSPSLTSSACLLWGYSAVGLPVVSP